MAEREQWFPAGAKGTSWEALRTARHPEGKKGADRLLGAKREEVQGTSECFAEFCAQRAAPGEKKDSHAACAQAFKGIATASSSPVLARLPCDVLRGSSSAPARCFQPKERSSSVAS